MNEYLEFLTIPIFNILSILAIGTTIYLFFKSKYRLQALMCLFVLGIAFFFVMPEVPQILPIQILITGTIPIIACACSAILMQDKELFKKEEVVYSE